jgi:hypothetical protein
MGTPWLTDCAPELDFFPSSKQAVCHCVHRASNVQLSFYSRIINCLAEVQDFIAVSAIGPELTRFARFVSRAILDPTSQPTPALECRGGWDNQLLPARPGQFFVAKATSLWEHFRDRDDEPVNGARSFGEGSWFAARPERGRRLLQTVPAVRIRAVSRWRDQDSIGAVTASRLP